MTAEEKKREKCCLLRHGCAFAWIRSITFANTQQPKIRRKPLEQQTTTMPSIRKYNVVKRRRSVYIGFAFFKYILAQSGQRNFSLFLFRYIACLFAIARWTPLCTDPNHFKHIHTSNFSIDCRSFVVRLSTSSSACAWRFSAFYFSCLSEWNGKPNTTIISTNGKSTEKQMCVCLKEKEELIYCFCTPNQKRM